MAYLVETEPKPDFPDGSYQFAVWQGGIKVVSGDAPSFSRAWSVLAHYVAVYSQDGPLDKVEFKRRKTKS